MQTKRNAEHALRLVVNRPGCEPIEAGTFSRYPAAWEAMEAMATGATGESLDLIDTRGVCRSCMLSGVWVWK